MAYTLTASRTATPRSNPAGAVADSAGSFAQTPAVSAATVGPAKPKLLDRMREALRTRHYSRRTEDTYCHWVKRFIFFHHVRHPAEMGEPEINAYLNDVKTTMIYTHVLNRGPAAVRSPVDAL